MMPNINLKAPNPMIIQKGLKELSEATSAELAEYVQMPKATVDAVLSQLYSKSMVHIGAWARNKQNNPVRIYTWGKGKDVTQPIKSSQPKNITVTDQLPWPRCDVAAQWLRNAA